jgi:hypothetical protein
MRRARRRRSRMRRIFARIGRGSAGRGARNKHSLAFEAYYAARGFKDPLVTAAEIVTTDPVALLAWFKQHDPKGSKKLNLVRC